MFNYIETYTILTITFNYLKGKNATFNSFIETWLSGCIVSHFVRQSANFVVGVSVFLASFGPISVKAYQNSRQFVFHL